MTMRSAPPASSFFAEMPAPAPAPMIGWPCAFMARKRARMSERGMRGMRLSLRAPSAEPVAEQPAELGGDFRRKARIVDMLRHTDEAARAGLPNRRLERTEQLRVGVRIGKWTTGRVESRHAALRQVEAAGTIHSIKPLADPAADARVLLRRGAHQRDGWIVDLQCAAAVAFGHAVHRSEIHHIERPT